MPTAAGPAECGRAGDSQHPYLVCNVLTSAGWKSYTSTPGDWGYAWLRGWVANRDGTISYCRAVADGSSLTCDTFTGTTWKTSAWFKTDVGYGDGNRTFLPTAAGPAECGRAGDSQHPYLVCNVLTSAGWKSYTSTPGDWGYAWLRGWVANRDGTISYCRAVADGSSLTCDTFTGTTWKTSAWFKTDVGYSN
ncbi:hypothetical protein ATK17_1768 [Branchiibius hedensis]|uniref:Uncharacterized protein n=2 Tax=Branchiibius TaxID=908251 RepID=A0A2Y8ZT79_9MICO|nr:hypothetical protein [Branchiibius hedensis]PWJ25635.1 hypothetical protein ATK17_1768 [Branchiibius hedensis]SSA34448.1 hypothetical protein SAMN04489750_1768 [Branchiibius hedensis]